MKVSVAWIGVILVVAILAYFSIYGYQIYEEFRSPPPSVKEGFEVGVDELTITTCPAQTNRFIDDGGRVLCCEGEAVGTRCNGKLVCSLSDNNTGLPTCGVWYKAFLDQKGQGKCPPSMPHYFERDGGRVKGCAATGLNPSGTGPRTPQTKFCTLYATAQQEDRNLDSCTNVAMLERTTCFPASRVRGSKKILEKLRDDLPPVVSCSYMSSNNFETTKCMNESSFARVVDTFMLMMNIRNSNWRENINKGNPYTKLQFCGPAEKFSIQKTVALKDVEKMNVF